MELASGRYLDFAEPDPAAVTLQDIARALSLTCRFGGHIPRFYSVAQHALMVRQLVIRAGHPELALAALHHDSHEAYIGDLPTPLKVRAGGEWIDVLTEDVDAAIAEALHLDVDLFHAEPIKRADELALRIEAWHLKPSRGVGGEWSYREPPPFVLDLDDSDPDDVAAEFISAHVNNWEVVT